MEYPVTSKEEAGLKVLHRDSGTGEELSSPQPIRERPSTGTHGDTVRLKLPYTFGHTSIQPVQAGVGELQARPLYVSVFR